MSGRLAVGRPPSQGGRRLALTLLTRVYVGALVLLAALILARMAGQGASPLFGGLLVLGLGAAALLAYVLWRDPSFGILLWLAASMVAVVSAGDGALAIDRLAFVALVGAWLANVATGRQELGRFGLPEALMLAFLALNVASAVALHELPALSPEVTLHATGDEPFSFVQAIQRGVLFPFAMYVLGRELLTDRARVIRFLWFLTGVGIYLGLTNVFTDRGPHSLVFPKVILNPSVGLQAEGEDRARGIFLNGAPTGTLLAIAFVAAAYLASQRGVRWRWVAVAALPVTLAGIYFTRTRAPILAALAVLLLGALLWRGSRRWFTIALALVAVLAIANLSTLTSSNRAAGGVGSAREIQDRQNIAATGFWAVGEKPVFGWGLGRYGILNTWDHRSWPGVDWNRGYGDIGHDTELSIAVELGLFGLALWLAVLASIVLATRRAWRSLPRAGLISRQLVLAFWIAGAAWFINESFIDMRLFPAVTGAVFAWAGMCVGLADRTAVAEVPEPTPAAPPAPARQLWA
jgi:O-Antigen ligase